MVLGGAPFHQPVRLERGAWVAGFRQPTYARELLIGPAQELDLASFAGPLKTVAVEGAGWTAPLPEAKRTWALTLRLTDKEDMPGQDGSAGPREGVARPLVHVLDAQGLARACPLLEVDRLRGPGQGGRWVFATSDARLAPETIRAAVARALDGAAELDARPLRAAVEPGETAVLRILVNRPLVRADEPAPKASVTVRDDGGRTVFTGEVAFGGTAQSRSALLRVAVPQPLAPGLYRASVELSGVEWQPRSLLTGFWVKDEKLLASGPKLSASRDWIRRDGRVLPVIGTTYMASDVHRKFLFEPNPVVWDRDFAQMRQQGINMVRTGLWTAWTRVMLDPGAVDENVLSALDAYVLSAARNDVLVCFNFFAFIPPAFGGTNPYLDPRSIEGQRAFIGRFAARYRGVGWVHWDLINEPSYARPQDVWRNRPDRRRLRAGGLDGVGEAQAWGRSRARARPVARRRRRPLRHATGGRDGLLVPARGPPAAQGPRLRRVLPGGGRELDAHAARDPEAGRRRRAGDARAGRRRHRHAPGPVDPLRRARLHVGAHLVEQRRPAVGRRRDEGPRGAEHAPGDGPDEPAGPRWLRLARAGLRREPARAQVRLRLRRPRHRRHPVGLEHQPVPADRQRGDHRSLAPRRHGQGRAARRGRVRAVLRAGGALARRLRARPGGAW